MNNTFYFISDVDEFVAREFAAFLDAVPDDAEVTIQMLSHGGLVFCGLGCCQMIAHAQTRGIKFTVNVYGIAASAAADIILACDIINIADGAKIMIHAAYNGSDESIEQANSEQIRLIHKRLPDYSVKDLKEDRWFSASEAVKIGLADSIISTQSNPEARICHLAAFYNSHKEDIVMAKTKSEIVEQEEVKKDEVIQNSEAGYDEEPKAADEVEAQPSVEDLFEAFLKRLEVIEHRLAVLEGEGKKADDELNQHSPSARRAALIARISSVCAPVSPVAEAITKSKEVAQSSDARCKALYKNFDEIVMKELRRSR